MSIHLLRTYKNLIEAGTPMQEADEWLDRTIARRQAIEMKKREQEWNALKIAADLLKRLMRN